MNREQRRRKDAAPPPGARPAFHVHAETQADAGEVTIPINAARILLDVCNLPAVAEHLQSSQAKLQVGYAQQSLEAALAKLTAAEPESVTEPIGEQPEEEAIAYG